MWIYTMKKDGHSSVNIESMTSFVHGESQTAHDMQVCVYSYTWGGEGAIITESMTVRSIKLHNKPTHALRSGIYEAYNLSSLVQ